MANEIKRVTSTEIVQKLDICFYHSKHNYHMSDHYKMVCIDIDQNNKNVMYYLKQIIHKQVNMLMPYIDNFYWYTQEKGQQIIMGKQKLLYRVNCLDCTMRTNAVMTQLSLKTMRDIQQILSIKKGNLQFQGLKDIVGNRWRQLGSRVSRLYCGQEQLQIGKKQQSGFFSMFSLNKDPMGSQFKQRSLQLFMNQVTPKQVLWIQKNLERKLNVLQHCTINSLKFFVLSWNCNNLNPLSINELSKQLLFKFNRGKIDVVIVNLQEMVELSTYNVLVTIDEQVKTKWKELLIQTLNQKITSDQEKFDSVAEENLVAITTWVFVKNRVKVRHFQGKQSTIVKTGFANGLGGNKGAVIIFLKFDSVWISVINCHLTAGEGKKSQRKQSLEQILYSWIDQKFRDRMSESDITLLIGDLNFRLEWTAQQIKSILYDVRKNFNKQSLKMGLKIDQENQGIINNLKTLWQKDELLHYKKDPQDFLNRFYEKPLVFMPTYKFIKKTHVDQYDQKRSPAWCDRILYEQKIDKIVTQITYQDVDVNLSDHKPVTALFDLKIKKIDSRDLYQKKFSQIKALYYKHKGPRTQKDQVDLSERIPVGSKMLNTDKIAHLEPSNQQSLIEVKPSNQQSLIEVKPSNQQSLIQHVKPSNQQFLIDMDEIKPRKDTSIVSTNMSANKRQKLLQIESSEEKKRISLIPETKNDFAQFHEIASQMQKKNSHSSQANSQNLIDFE